VRTVVLGPRPPELEAVLERRRALGQDLYDEVWAGEYHMAPEPSHRHALLDDEVAAVLRPLARRAGLVGSGPFNLGRPGDYRVPDRGLHRGRSAEVWVPTAAMVVEILSPDDETFDKFAFYARHRVDEVLVVDPALQTVRCWRLSEESYVENEASGLLGVTVAEMPGASPGLEGQAAVAVPGELLVGYVPGSSSAEQDRARGRAGTALAERVVTAGPICGKAHLVRLPHGRERDEVIAPLYADSAVHYAEPNWLVHSHATSTDPYYQKGNLWGMYVDTTSPASQYGSQAGRPGRPASSAPRRTPRGSSASAGAVRRRTRSGPSTTSPTSRKRGVNVVATNNAWGDTGVLPGPARRHQPGWGCRDPVHLLRGHRARRTTT
jgi:hypothetical protein